MELYFDSLIVLYILLLANSWGNYDIIIFKFLWGGEGKLWLDKEILWYKPMVLVFAYTCTYIRKSQYYIIL